MTEQEYINIMDSLMNPEALVEGFPAPDGRVTVDDDIYELMSEIRHPSLDFSVADYSKEMEKIGWEHVRTTDDRDKIISTYRKKK